MLLIDDDEVTNFYNTHILNKMGVAEHIHFEMNGENGLKYLTDKANYDEDYVHPELILLDINMPIMNGFEFLDAYEKLSEAERGKHLIVMLTSSPLSMDMDRAHSFPSLRDYITKPLKENQVNELLEKYFGESGAA
ncbi:MAG: response regulator [Bacteroidota bacterium]